MGSFGRLSSFWNRAGELLKDSDAQPSGESQNNTRPMEPPTADGREFQDEYYDESGDRRVWISEPTEDDERYEHGLPRGWFSFRRLWLFMGPGFLMSIAYLVIFRRAVEQPLPGMLTSSYAINPL